jgi:hypothetical protein
LILSSPAEGIIVRAKYFILAAVFFLLFSQEDVSAQSIYVLKGEEKEEAEGKPLILNLPYAFYDESFGGAAAWVYGATGWPQRQAQFVATVIGGTNSTATGYFLGKDFQMPWVPRLFLDPIIGLGHSGLLTAIRTGIPISGGSRRAPTILPQTISSRARPMTILPT